ncbi:A/G-specific adenine glycosylase [Chthonobacter albigriseus]|uniref:A/G-specific adenine glycosylase n=1 Tax=Chthonobacter albigriseus TaxID=1683161 RepID=UPI0015EF210C|nr:A/G-specific adenine glycosylase [Chthonobacter albigriseus]
MPLPLPDARDLLAWYDRHARRLPWRVSPEDRALGVLPDPYRVWLSEIMLQQTTVTAVKSYFDAFTARWPRLVDLAAAERDDVMKAWAGLGYYSRARNLKACADAVASLHGGRFPDTEEGLRTLPGIGAYTAAAIAAIAFDRRAAVVDGNVERVITRIRAVETPLPNAKPIIREIVDGLTPADRPGDFAQAMMDLGATICTPKRPACGLCPWSSLCMAREAGTQETFPRKAAKKERPVRYGAAFVAIRSDGAVLLRQRPDRGLLGGMTEVPGSEWSPDRDVVAPTPPPVPGEWRRLPQPVEHTFTHFHLVLTVHAAEVDAAVDAPIGTWWSPAETTSGEALPSVMRKVVEAAVPGLAKRRR